MIDPKDLDYIRTNIGEAFEVELPDDDDPRQLAFIVTHDDVIAHQLTEVVEAEVAALAAIAGVSRVYREDAGQVCVQGDVDRSMVVSVLNELWFDAALERDLL